VNERLGADGKRYPPGVDKQMSYWRHLARRPHWTAATATVAASVGAGLSGNYWLLAVIAAGIVIEALAALREWHLILEATARYRHPAPGWPPDDVGGRGAPHAG